MARQSRVKQSQSQQRRNPSRRQANSVAKTAAQTSSDTDTKIVLTRHIEAETVKQRDYLTSILKNTLTIGVGPAGTGKTFVSIYAAARLYAAGIVTKIVVIRAAVEAGEKLGFLPGDQKEKTDPYFETVIDVLKRFLEPGRVDCDIKNGNIQCVTLAFLRSGTLDNAIVLLEEAQNLTLQQMKLALTRAGRDTRYVISGDDEEQCDLPKGTVSGLTDAKKRFGVLAQNRPEDNPEGISVGMVSFTEDDIVRSGFCKMVIKQYRKPLSSF